jgi:hypothetical protein
MRQLESFTVFPEVPALSIMSKIIHNALGKVNPARQARGGVSDVGPVWADFTLCSP